MRRSEHSPAPGGVEMLTAPVAPRELDDFESPDAAGDAAPQPAPHHPRPRQRHPVRTKRRLAFAGIVIAGAIGFLLYKGLTSAVVYFKTANEAVAARSQLGDSTFQLEGVVVSGTVRQLSGGRVAFTVTGGGASIPVVNTGDPPQLFRAGIPVVVVGHFSGTSNLFVSDQILVKHSNQYIAEYPSRVTVPPTTTPTTTTPTTAAP
jgi:cytochrome c-type biogenesis protein CcmE